MIFLIILILIAITLYMSTNHISYENIDDFIVMDSDNKPGGEIDKKASLILSMLDKDIQYLLNHLKHKYANKDHRVNILIKNYARDDLRENNKNTYVVGKGDKIYLCLRNNGKILEYNILMFVLLHELAHMVTPEYNHTPLFWNNNVWIMKEAESIRIFNNVDYSKSPVYYCNNMYIDVNPSFVESN